MKPKIQEVSDGPWILRALCVRAAGAGLLFAPSGSRKFPFQNCRIPSFGLRVWVRQEHFALLHSKLVPFWEEKRGGKRKHC